MRVLFFGSYDTEAHPRVAVLIEGMRRHIGDVEECNVPLGVGTQERVSIVASGRNLPRLAWRIGAVWVRLLLRARAVASPDAVIVGYLGHFDVLLARLRFPHALIVLDYLVSGLDTAGDRQIGSPFVRRMLAALDRAALSAADLVIVDTDAQRDFLPESMRSRSVVVPVGATGAWFHEPGANRSERLSVVFYGTFTPLQGAVTIGRAIARLANEPIDFTMVGMGQDHQACRDAARGNPNVKWIDWIPGSELPALVRDHDVCLGIFGASSKAGRVVPTKAFQGAASGCLVVTSDTPVQREIIGEAGRFVPPADAEALAQTLRALLRSGELTTDRHRSYAWADEHFRSDAVVERLRDRLVAVASTSA